MTKLLEKPTIVPGGSLRLAPREGASAQLHSYLQPIALPFELPTRMYGAMLAIWHLRPLLQRRFPLHKGRPRDFVRFLAWCASEGRRSYAILRAIPAWDAELGKPLDLPELLVDSWGGGYSVAMFLYGVARQRYSFTGILTDARVRARVARAFWRGDRHDRLLPAPQPWQYEFLGRRFGSAEDFIETLRLPRTDGDQTAEELVTRFGLGDLVIATAEATFARTGAAVPLPARLRRSPFRLPLRAIRYLSQVNERLTQTPSEFELTAVTARIAVGGRRPTGEYPFGVNLFGYARGELGIGEDVRLMALALQAHGIPFCVINIEPGANVSQQDVSAESWISDRPRYAINIFCSTGIELVRYACEQGLEFLQDRYTIGLWPWELPRWPESWKHAFSLVDELWGISSYTAKAYQAAGRPVHAMTLPVTVEPIGPECRADFGLPKDDFLFVFSFDFNSTLTRKNPEGLVRAFQKAFPRSGKERVGLVLKVSHTPQGEHPQWSRLKRMINADPRIHLIDTTLRKPQVLALYRCCDCFVSLHRAEGFGRGIAEALLLDLRVIATGFSGNLDFCAPDRVSLVRHEIRELGPAEYFSGAGQCWAEPDLDHAAELMRQSYAKPRIRKSPTPDFSPLGVGWRYRRRLLDIKQELKLKGHSTC